MNKSIKQKSLCKTNPNKNPPPCEDTNSQDVLLPQILDPLIMEGHKLIWITQLICSHGSADGVRLSNRSFCTELRSSNYPSGTKKLCKNLLVGVYSNGNALTCIKNSAVKVKKQQQSLSHCF